MSVSFHVSANKVNSAIIRPVDHFEPYKFYLVKYRNKAPFSSRSIGNIRYDYIVYYNGDRLEVLFERTAKGYADWKRPKDDSRSNVAIQRYNIEELPFTNSTNFHDVGEFFEINDAVGSLMLPTKEDGQSVPGLTPERALVKALHDYKQQEEQREERKRKQLEKLYKNRLPLDTVKNIMSYNEILPPFSDEPSEERRRSAETPPPKERRHSPEIFNPKERRQSPEIFNPKERRRSPEIFNPKERRQSPEIFNPKERRRSPGTPIPKERKYSAGKKSRKHIRQRKDNRNSKTVSKRTRL